MVLIESRPMTATVFLLLAYVLCQVAWAFGMAIAGLLFGVGIQEVGLFFEPVIVEFEIAEVRFRLNWLPLGSYVKYREDDFANAGPLRAAAMSLGGCVVLLAIAGICFPSGAGLDMVATGFREIVMGAISPLGKGRELATQAIDFIRGHGFVAILGATAAKMCAFNLLPLPSSNSGHSLLMLWKGLFTLSAKVQVILTLIGMLLTILMALSWIVAIGIALFTQGA
jgi:membrane-associated protease RseP (regulator of RpoE activity)